MRTDEPIPIFSPDTCLVNRPIPVFLLAIQLFRLDWLGFLVRYLDFQRAVHLQDMLPLFSYRQVLATGTLYEGKAGGSRVRLIFDFRSDLRVLVNVTIA